MSLLALAEYNAWRTARVPTSYAVAAGRPHLVTNAGDASMTILVLQGVGEYDYVPLV